MASLMHSESRRLYSWWWDSHMSPKNSKWLQDNLTDIDAKVKVMIKLINEDADSFARRAEMYYKKRPELMKLVEEFYRAYRALAERYDHATGELRQAHRTMDEAFPNQVPFVLNDDTPSSSEPQSPQTSPQIFAFFDPDDLNKESNVRLTKKGLKQFNEMFQAVESMARDSRSADKVLRPETGMSRLSDENQHLKAMVADESERAAKAEAEIKGMKEALVKVEAERDGILGQYKESLEKLTNLEKELGLAQKDVRKLNKLANEAGYEVIALKESLVKVEAERDCSLSRYNESSKKVATLETMLAALREDAARLSQQAAKAETESENIKEELSRSEAEKKAALARHEEFLEKMFSLENKLLLAEENAKMIHEQNKRAENEVKALKDDISTLKKEKEDLYLRYQECLSTISKLHSELREAKEDLKRLNNEVLLGSAKLKGAEDHCASLQKMNESLKLEADDLARRIAVKDQQLSKKQDEFDKLMNRLHEEQSRFLQVEATLQALQNLHSQSQEEQRALALELRNGLQMLKDLELCKRDLEGQIKDLREENRGLNDLKLASSILEKNMEVEISNLKDIKEKLEAEVIRQMEQNDAVQRQVHHLKQEIEDLSKKYQDVLQQVESSGIDLKCISSSFSDLKEENSRLEQISSAERTEKEALMKRLADMELLLQRSALLESTLSHVNAELESSKEKVESLQDSCSVLNGEKAILVIEKSALFSQLQIVTESMQKLLGKNASLENLLHSANTELEGLRVKSKSLEDFCQLIDNERSNLLNERSSLISRLEYVEKKLENLETRFTKLEERYAGIEKEKESTRNQVEELRVSLGIEKEQRACLVLTSETRLSGLEDQIQNLQQENRSRKKEFEEQLDKAVNAQVEIFILQKFMQDMEQKNYTLLVERQKHVEAAKYSEKIISELESENMMYQVETEFLLDRMAKLRIGICQVLKVLEIDCLSEPEPENLLPVVPGNIKQIRRNLSKITDENYELLVENNVLSTVIGQLNLEGLELASCKEALDREFLFLDQKIGLLEHENASLMVRSRELDMVVAEKERGQETLKAELESLHSKQAELQREYAILQEQHMNVIEANRCLQGKLSVLQEENDSVTVEALSLNNHCVVLKAYGVEKAMELDRVTRDMHNLLEAYKNLENEARVFRKNLAEKEAENLLLRESIRSLEEKKRELRDCYDQFRDCYDQLNFQVQSEKKLVNQKEAELSEAKLKITVTEDMNAEMHRTVEGLQKQCEGLEVTCESLEMQIVELCVDKEHLGKEIGRLREDNERLESEIDELSGEIEEYKIREVILSSELNERSSEFELWEAEAASFYFDFQISSVREVLLENKVNELSGLCEGLEDLSSRRSLEIERMKGQISFLQGETSGLKAQLDTYVPVIASLKENISSLEQNLILQPKLPPDGSLDPEVEAFTVHEIKEIKSLGLDDQSLSAQDNLSALQELQARIKKIESTLVEEMLKVSEHECMKSNYKLEEAMKEIEELRLKIHSLPDRNLHEFERKPQNHHGKSLDTVLDPSSEVRNGAQMKDILLDHVSDSSFSSNRRGSGRRDDQMLELWETHEHSSGHDSIPQETQPQKSGSRSRKNGNLYHQLEIREERSNMGSGQIEKELGVDKMEMAKTLTESNHGANSKKVILERLASDAQLLMSLQISLHESRGKMETDKRSNNSPKDVEYKRLRAQLEEVENSVNQLVEMNAELVKTAEAGPTCPNADMVSLQLVEAERAQRKKISEQARRGSERIGRLQLEMQKIQYALLKMEDEQNKNIANNYKKISQGKSKFSRSRPGIILNNFIYSRGRSTRKQKKPQFCGCFKRSHKAV